MEAPGQLPSLPSPKSGTESGTKNKDNFIATGYMDICIYLISRNPLINF